MDKRLDLRMVFYKKNLKKCVEIGEKYIAMEKIQNSDELLVP